MPALATDELRTVLTAMDADVKASLALGRATLRALSALSPLLNTATEAALEEEVDRAVSPRTRDVVEDALLRIQRAPGEARMAQAMERALLDAADRLACAAEGEVPTWRSVRRKSRANAA